MPIKFANMQLQKCFTWSFWILYAAVVRLSLDCFELRLCWAVMHKKNPNVSSLNCFFFFLRKKKKTSLNIAWFGEGKITANLILKLSTEYDSVFCTVAASNGCSWNPEKVCPPSSSLVGVNNPWFQMYRALTWTFFSY